MHDELRSFFDRHRASTAAHKRAMHDQLDAIHAVSAAVQRHALELQLELERAERAAHEHDLDSTMQWLHNAILVTKQRVEAFHLAGRELTRALTDLEFNTNRGEADIEHLIARASGRPTPIAAPNGAEHP